MGVRNYLVDGVSCAGKTSVAGELEGRGFRVVHGDRELAYQGDPVTGEPTPGHRHEHHVWPVDRVRALVADRADPVTFFCGGSRNSARFVDLFDAVFVLEIDADTLRRRLEARPAEEWGGPPPDPAFVVGLLESRVDLPVGGLPVDATRPLDVVVDDLLRRCGVGPEDTRLR